MENFLISTLRLATPLIFAALAGLLSEKSGVIQIGLEGMMLVSALAAAVATLFSGSPWVGLLCAILVGMAWAQIFAFFTLRVRADQIISGTALNLLAIGLCPYITKILFDSTGSTPSISLENRFQSELIWLALLAVPCVWFLVTKTRWGLWLQFAGESPLALASAGHSVGKVRWLALCFTGALCGFGGASLSIALASSYSPLMTAGRGFIALAALIFGGWKPVPAFAACLFFASIEAAQIQIQNSPLLNFVPIPFLQILPYVVTIIALVGFFGHQRVPKGLGQHV